MNRSDLEVLRDTWNGCLSFTRNGLALVGLTALCVVTLALAQPDFSNTLKNVVLRALPAGETDEINQLANAVSVPAAAASDMLGLTQSGQSEGEGRDGVTLVSTRLEGNTPVVAKEQAAITRFITRKYRVSPEAVELLVHAAYLTGEEVGIDPTLLLAVMAIESRFNPFAESVMGAQGLMQVMSRVHTDKLEDFGGQHAALNPVANIKVGALILKDCIRRGGSVSNGLGLYVGAGMGDDNGYGAKVLREQERIRLASRMSGIRVANAKPALTPVVAPAARVGEELVEKPDAPILPEARVESGLPAQTAVAVTTL